MNHKAKIITYCGLFAAITAVLSQVAIPMVPVPVNLAMLSVFVAAGLLGPLAGTISQVAYVAIGAIGLPVFAGFKGGFGAIIGPTGGYIIGYIFATLISALLIKRSKNKFYLIAPAMLLGLAVCYAFGTAWFMYISGSDFVRALLLCVVPFLAGDALKITLATFLTIRLKKFALVPALSGRRRVAR